MSDVHSGGVQSRPLFVNAEALRVDVRAPSGGGGDKYEPQTLEQAQVLLAPQVEAAAASAAEMPVSLRARGHVYVEAKLLPNYLAASYFPTELLSHLGATPVVYLLLERLRERLRRRPRAPVRAPAAPLLGHAP